MIAPKLFQRYFMDQEEEVSRDLEVERQRDEARAMTALPAYVRLRRWIELELEERRVGPASHESMLYSSGIVEGLNIVKSYLIGMETEAHERD